MSRIISIGPVLIIQGLNLVYLILVAELTLLNGVSCLPNSIYSLFWPISMSYAGVDNNVYL